MKWLSKTLQRIRNHHDILQRQREYNAWIEKRRLSPENLGEIAAEISRFANKPTISIILPVYNVHETWLRKCIDSVIQQVYPYWHLCVADDRSDQPHIKPLLKEYAAADDRIKVVFRAQNGHISAASNSALDLATGEYVALLDNDDELSPDALFWVAKEINEHPTVKVVYSDEDVIDAEGRRSAPKFKPDLSRDLLYSVNYINHLTVYKRAIVNDVGRFRIGMEGSQDYDLLLRVLECTEESEVRHISRILYHWRAVEGSVAKDSRAKSYAHENARTALREHFGRLGKSVTVKQSCYDFHRVIYTPNGPPASVTIIPIQPLSRPAKLIASRDVRVIEPTGNTTAALNHAVSMSDSTIICFLDGRLEPFDGRRLDELFKFAVQPEIGAAGGRIIDDKDRVVEGGIVVGTSELISVGFQNFDREFPDTIFRNCLIGNYSAVSVACVALKKTVFDEVGQLDTQYADVRLAGVDLCLKLREKGYRIAFLPHVEFRVAGNKSPLKLSSMDQEIFKRRWQRYFENGDPFYNTNLSLRDGSYSLDI
jgi:glycosyltransferase involved in cell wall biosynthesis